VDDLIVETGERAGVTSIVITHDMASVFRIGDVVNYLTQGACLPAHGVARRVPPLLTTNAAMREFLEASGITL
jgi:phospholipid/cholesterol/gamma-HCH transport system ATP-binding protein